MQNKHSTNRWHAVSVDDTLKLLTTDMTVGLKNREVHRRKKSVKRCLWHMAGQTSWRLLFGEFIDFSAVMLILTVIVAAVFEYKRDAALICTVLVVSSFLRGATALVAERIHMRAASENIPKAHVLRDGKCVVVSASEIVPGDILLLFPGDTVAADIRLCSGGVTVSETDSEGKRVLRKKQHDVILPAGSTCDKRSNIVFAGSVVVSGCGRGAVFACGEKTYAFARNGHIALTLGDQIPVLEKLAGWSRFVSLWMIFLVVVLTFGGIFVNQSNASVDTLFLASLALAVSSMGEFLPVIARIIMACSVRMLMSATDDRVVIKKRSAIETLAAADLIVFGSDKYLQTGNIRIGSWSVDGENAEAGVHSPDDSLLMLLRLTKICTEINAVQTPDTFDFSHLSELNRYSSSLLESLYPGESVVTEGTTIDRCFATNLHTVLRTEAGNIRAYVCGSLQDVLSCCSNIRLGGSVEPLDAKKRTELLEQDASCRRQGIRTVALAVRLSPCNNLAKVSQVQTRMMLIGYYTVIDPVSSTLSRYVSRCEGGKIRLVVLTDDCDAAAAFCRQSGILHESEPVYIAPTFLSMLEQQIPDGNFLVGYTALQDKIRIAEMLSRYSERMVYVGEDLTDMACFAHADVSAAYVSSDRNNALCVSQKADVIIMNDAPPSADGTAVDLLRAVGFAKNAMVNLCGAAKYLIISQIIRFTVVMASVFFGIPMLSPLRILLWGLLIDFAAVLVKAFVQPRIGTLACSASEIALPKWGGSILYLLLCGVSVGLLISLLPVFARLLPIQQINEQWANLLYISGIMASFTASVMVGRRESIFNGGYKVSFVSMLYGVFVIAAVLLTVMPLLMRGIGYLPHICLSLVPSLLLFQISEIKLIVSRDKK